MSPRIEPVPATGNRTDIQGLLEMGEKATGGAANVLRTMARHRSVFRHFVPFSGALLVAGKLPPRDRELLILRTAWLCRCDYEWGQHVRIGLAEGVTDDEVACLAGDLDPAHWSADDFALLRAADQLVADHRLDDGTWAALADRYDERQLIEVLMIPGAYTMLAGFLNTLEVEREPGVAGLPGSAR